MTRRGRPGRSTTSERLRLGVLAGDGIGREVVPAALDVLGAAGAAEGVALDVVDLPMGHRSIELEGTALSERTLAALGETDGAIVGPHDSQSYPEAERSRLNPSGRLRKHFDLFANIRPARAFPGLPATRTGIDLVIVRENTEGFYADRNMAVGSGEMMPTPDLALAVGVITRRATERIARAAFALARRRRRRVTIVHKANVLRLSHGLFRDVCLEVGASFPDVSVDQMHVDAAMVHLLRKPEEYDVLVTENMLGDILSDLTGELAGSLGMAASLNAGGDWAMAQAAHGAAPDIAGRGVANPVAIIQSTAMLLAWLAERRGSVALERVATRIERAIATALDVVDLRTPDLGGRGTTVGLADAIRAAASG